MPLLTRHLGVDDYGGYVVVSSVLGIAVAIADAGLGAVGLREWAIRDATGRHRLIRNVVTMRLALAIVASVAAVLFALAAGYDATLVVGTAIGALAVVLTMVQITYSVPLVAGLRLETNAAIEFLRQAGVVAGILILVWLGSGLLGFFAVPIPVALVVLLVTLVALKPDDRARPGFDRGEWSYLVAETVPAAASAVLASLFYRVAIVVMSLLASPEETGYFGLSQRVSDVFIAIPWLVVGSALALLARAAETDRDRFAAAYKHLFDASLILGVGCAFILVAGAGPIVGVLGGPDFAPAVPVLQIQGLAVACTFLVTLFGAALWIVRAKRQLVVGNALGISVAVGLTVALVPLADAVGAAVAMVIAESLLVLVLGGMLPEEPSRTSPVSRNTS